MSIRNKVFYTTRPSQEHPRRHAIPVEAVQLALNDPQALLSSLQMRQCLVKIIVIDNNRIVARYPQTLMQTTTDNDLVCSEEQFPNFPVRLSDHARIVVELLVID